MGKKAKKKETETDIEKLDRYESDRSEEELSKFQGIKSGCFFTSYALLLIATFLPSGTDWHDAHGSLVSIFATLNIVGLIYMIFMLFQDNRKHKIQKTVLKKNAPHFGYDKKVTFLTYEIFVLFTLYFLVEQCIIVAFARDGWAIAGTCLTALSFAAAVVARFTLANATCGHMKFIQVEEPPQESGENKDAEKADEEKAEEGTNDPDDFYAPIKKEDTSSVG